MVGLNIMIFGNKILFCEVIDGMPMPLMRYGRMVSIIAQFSAILTVYFSSNLCVLPFFIRQWYFIVIALFMVLLNMVEEFNKLMLLLFSICGISIAVNDIPSFFRSEQRFMYFVVMLIAIGPVIKGQFARAFRFAYWRALILCFVVASVLSFVAYLLSWGPAFHAHNLLCGILTHSMSLGPVAGVSTVFLLWTVYSMMPANKSVLFFLVGMIFICFATCALSGSRSAFISCALGGGFVTYTFPAFRKFKYFFILITILLFVSLVIYYTGWSDRIFESMLIKQQYSESRDSVFASREALWDVRIYEFKKNPLCGVGFGSVSLENPNCFDDVSGVVEPGNAWLFVLSSIGIFGGLVIFIIYFVPIFKLFIPAMKEDNLARLILSVLVFYMVHMFAEGYLLSAGNLSFALVWSTIAVAWDYCGAGGVNKIHQQDQYFHRRDHNPHPRRHHDELRSDGNLAVGQKDNSQAELSPINGAFRRSLC